MQTTSIELIIINTHIGNSGTTVSWWVHDTCCILILGLGKCSKLSAGNLVHRSTCFAFSQKWGFGERVVKWNLSLTKINWMRGQLARIWGKNLFLQTCSFFSSVSEYSWNGDLLYRRTKNCPSKAVWKHSYSFMIKAKMYI